MERESTSGVSRIDYRYKDVRLSVLAMRHKERHTRLWYPLTYVRGSHQDYGIQSIRTRWLYSSQSSQDLAKALLRSRSTLFRWRSYSTFTRSTGHSTVVLN